MNIQAHVAAALFCLFTIFSFQGEASILAPPGKEYKSRREWIPIKIYAHKNVLTDIIKKGQPNIFLHYLVIKKAGLKQLTGNKVAIKVQYRYRYSVCHAWGVVAFYRTSYGHILHTVLSAAYECNSPESEPWWLSNRIHS